VKRHKPVTASKIKRFAQTERPAAKSGLFFCVATASGDARCFDKGFPGIQGDEDEALI
jgi:hypothetical protein